MSRPRIINKYYDYFSLDTTNREFLFYLAILRVTANRKDGVVYKTAKTCIDEIISDYQLFHRSENYIKANTQYEEAVRNGNNRNKNHTGRTTKGIASI